MISKVIRAMLAMQRYPWEQGVCAQALFEAGQDEIWIPMAYDAVKRMDSFGRLGMVGGGEVVSDPAANGLHAGISKDERGFLSTGCRKNVRLFTSSGTKDEGWDHLS